MADPLGFELELDPVGEDGAGYRLQNIKDIHGVPQKQRTHLIQDGQSFRVRADFHCIAHGTEEPNGQESTLLVIDFTFSGPSLHQRRFRQAIITLDFAEEDKPLGGDLDPVVLQIAPNGTFFQDPATQNRQSNLNASVSINPPPPVPLSITAGWQSNTSGVKKDWMRLIGEPLVTVRNSGEYNTAEWSLRENLLEKLGIQPFVRTAVVVKPRTEKGFRMSIKVDTVVNPLHDTKERAKKFIGQGEVVDPVYFDVKGKRQTFGPAVAKEDLDRLATCDLTQLSLTQVRLSLFAFVMPNMTAAVCPTLTNLIVAVDAWE
jgi:hypothetical protein